MPRVVGVDVGGTFTDVVVAEEGGLIGFKVATTADQADGVAGALDWRRDDTLLHGTTAATNALLEERGAAVTLVTDSGYEDLIEIARQDRPSLYDSSVDRPTPLVGREHRIGHRGDRKETVARVSESSPDVVVVGLLEAYQDREQEQELAALLRDALGVAVVEAASVSPEFREYERLATGTLSAYLTPAVSGYLRDLDSRLPGARNLVMTSAGGLVPFLQAAEVAGRLVLSGPAGGVVAASALARHHGHGEAIAFDMGGTSTDVCRIVDGSVPVGSGHRVAGRVNRVPSVPVTTIGAGGGSVAWVDPGGGLRVGPRSAGAMPGPAAYGQGGSEPTVTDANLVVGHLPPDLALGGSLRMDLTLAVSAVSRLADAVSLPLESAAHGVLEVVDSHMEHALRSVSVEVGADPRDSVLIAYGGAGGLHASRLARRLGIPKVLVPPLSGVFSALGLLLAAPRADSARTVMLADGADALAGLTADIRREAATRFLATFDVGHTGEDLEFDCRYRGQSHELGVGAEPVWEAVRASFEEAHRRHFGFARPGETIEIVNVRVSVFGDAPLSWEQLLPALPHRPPDESGGIWRRSLLPAGFEIAGPAILVEDTSAILLEAGDFLAVLDDGTLEISVG